ncbi:hypothetical protein EAI30_10205 [Romboutsia ilealis]|uniref:HK97 gp10 family phage protein n=1 Tax=Romboutsia faecis TaxID=2764597 RepID=A0ABR7JNA9_9FIRM|nr:HK97 gp10 family phage protein [Romboutsia faecis]MBC5996375.1 hypothetical protein [Romboutsia faecis]MRN24989.1 hypothetical protein [Romboutsia ilealis]
MSKCNLNSLADTLYKELKSYSEDVTESVKKITEEVAVDLVKRTKADAKIGRRRGKYKKAIASKTKYENKYKKIKVWYVKQPEHRLAHLLNHGHKSKDGGFVKGDNHITKNEKIAIKELETKIERVVKDGS